MVRSGPGWSGPGRSSVRSGPTRRNLRVFGKTRPDRPDRRTKWSKTPDRDRTDYPSVQSGLCRAGPVFRSGSVLDLRCSALDRGIVLTRSRLVLLNAARPIATVVPQPTVKSLKLEINGGYVAFCGNLKGGKITGEDPLGKFNGKADEGFLVGYPVTSKAFRVFNNRTRIVQETLHINFLENQPNVAGSRPKWLFDIDTLTQSMNYQPVVAWNQPNLSAGIQENLAAGKVRKENISVQQYVVLPLWSMVSKNPQNTGADAAFNVKENEKEIHVSPSSSDKPKKHDEKAKREAKKRVLWIYPQDAPVTAVRPNPTNNTNSFNAADMPSLEDIVYSDDKEVVGAEADFYNLETNISVSPILTTRVYKDHHITQIIDLDYLDKVYKVVNALYGLHQAPRAWYETLATYLLENGFQKGKIDQTLFIKKQKGDILLVQVYVDDIIFGSTHKKLCKAFEKLMKDKFQTSSIGELTFFLGLQVKQNDDGIFISQDKYVAKILRKFGLIDGKSASTSIDTEKPLLKDPDGEDVDVHIYRSMIHSLMYLTSSRLDIMFVVCTCARFKITPKASHLHVVKRISDYAGASLDRKSTTRGCQFLSCRLISWQCKKQTVVTTSLTKAEYVAAASYYAQVLWIQNQLLDYGDYQAQAEGQEVRKEEEIKALWFKEDKEELDVDEDVTLVDVDTAVEMDADIQGRMEEDVTAVKEINAVEPEPIVFDDEKPISVAQAIRNMIAYLKNMAGYKMQYFKGMTYNQVRPIFEREYNKVQTFLKSNRDKEPIKKRVAKETLLQESFKKLRAEVEVPGSKDTLTVDPTEMSKEDVQNMLQIVPVAEFKVEALQVKYPLID
uniref:Putative ribonuclease H-like domain-containing protein n=1 Tax=Tanacetum cinerariifolium TaxID=118510 RepID=A0A699GRP3_TANCI|nr:putative ribonuclease H-like domain-containing protein [Tanacetum cinerariifolium]